MRASSFLPVALCAACSLAQLANAQDAAPAPPTPGAHHLQMHQDFNLPMNLAIDLGDLQDFGPFDFDHSEVTDLKLPRGTWWRDEELTKRIGISAEQQKRIEDLFLQNKIQLIHLHADLQEQELLLKPTLDSNSLDQTKALAQISKIADTRAELEKANARMLLGIRGVLSADQWTKLQAERAADRERGMREMRLMMDRMRDKGHGPGAHAPIAPPASPAK